MRAFTKIIGVGLLASTLTSCVITRDHSGDPMNGMSEFSEEPTIRVLLVENAREVSIFPDGMLVFGEGDRTFTGRPEGNDEYIVTRSAEGLELTINGDATLPEPMPSLAVMPEEGTVFTIKNVPFGVGWWWEGAEDRLYDATLQFHPSEEEGLIDVILHIKTEEYLRGVVPSEIGPTAPTEALKAQAVAARSETITALREGVYEGPNYDICSDVNCQVYSGLGKRNEATDAAIRATRGIVLTYDGETIPAYYASNCGGYSEDIIDVWPERDRGTPVWNGVPEGPVEPSGSLTDDDVFAEWVNDAPAVYCNRAAYPELPEWTQKNFRWEVTTTAEDLSARLKETGHDVGTVTAIEPVERGVSGRMTRVRFVGTEGQAEVGPELAIRRIWAPPLKSSAFIVEPQGPEGGPESFLIRGAGYGHGVGMCQTGAMGRAVSGQSYEEILTQYYRETEVMKLYP